LDPPTKPLLIFDGDCHFCRRWIARWQEATGDRVEYVPYQEAAERFPEIPSDDFTRSVVLIQPDGGIFRGAEAVLLSLAVAGRGRTAHWCYRHVPGFAPATELFYRAVAGNRHAASWVTRLLWGRSVELPSYLLTRWLFLRSLALVYLVAFVSLWVQVDGLIGSQGILPVKRYLDLVREQVGARGYWVVPTLTWLDSSDGALHLLCGGGVLLAALLFFGVTPRLCLLGLWAAYLSLAHAGQVFLSFQWDTLLLETGFLAIFFAPGNLLPGLRREKPPSWAFLWVLRWLLFKLMFASGLVKLWSGDETWWDLTALEYHYWTTCLPTWTGWHVHQLPALLHRSSVAIMFVIELAIPFLIFCPRRLRLASFYPLVALQLGIIATGNYGFFNLNTIVLCLLVLDDSVLRRHLPARWSEGLTGRPRRRGNLRRRLAATVAVLLFLLSLSVVTARFLGRDFLPAPVLQVQSWVRPFRSVNNYGLFANMTTHRREIILEGSNDGRAWEPYEFRWKPGDPARRPAFVQPHMPRLDWQMWFAALGDYRRNPWLIRCMQQILADSPAVLGLLAENPFPDAPPRYLRAVVYDYRFTDGAARKAEGTWWQREPRGLYAPVLRRSAAPQPAG
jgi:predicted DCC family thiol-disulfide oxidoreductase YuxK